MKTYALETLPPPLAALVEEVKDGEEIVLTDHAQPVARIVSPTSAQTGNGSHIRPRFGCLAEKIHLTPEFDETVEDFKDYMQRGCSWILTRSLERDLPVPRWRPFPDANER